MNSISLSVMRLLSLFFFLSTFTNLFAGPFREPLLNAIHENNIVLVKDLVRKGVNLNPLNAEVMPLNLAAANGSAEIVKILIENGARVDGADKYGLFPFDFCVAALGNDSVKKRRAEFLWILQYLIDKGVDVNAADRHGSVPLTWAMHHPYGRHISQGCEFDTIFAELLIYNGADLRLVDARFAQELMPKFKKALNAKYLTNLEGVQYTISDLGTLESESSIAYSINENGTVCGSYVLRDARFYYLHSQSEGLVLVDLPKTAVPKKINLRNQVVGNYKTWEGYTHGFIWDSTSGFVDIGTLGGENSWVSDVNNSGEVVGSSETGGVSVVDLKTKEIHAFAWKKNRITDLESLKGDLGYKGDKSEATAINDQGDIVGFSSTVILHKGKIKKGDEKAFIVKRKGNMEELFPSACAWSKALDINNAGQVIAVQQTKHDCYRYTVFNVDNGQQWEFANTSGGFVDLFPLTINDYGVVAVSGNRKLIIQKENRSQVLNLDLAIDGAYWRKLEQVLAINNKGYAVGVAKNKYGEHHAVLLSPKR